MQKNRMDAHLTVQDVLQPRDGSKYQHLMSLIRDYIIREKNTLGRIDYPIDTFGMPSRTSCPIQYVIFPEKLDGPSETQPKNDKLNNQSTRRFGKRTNADKSGIRMRKLLYSRNEGCVSCEKKPQCSKK